MYLYAYCCLLVTVKWIRRSAWCMVHLFLLQIKNSNKKSDVAHTPYSVACITFQIEGGEIDISFCFYAGSFVCYPSYNPPFSFWYVLPILPLLLSEDDVAYHTSTTSKLLKLLSMCTIDFAFRHARNSVVGCGDHCGIIYMIVLTAYCGASSRIKWKFNNFLCPYLQAITFPDFFLADIFTSMSKVWSNLYQVLIVDCLAYQLLEMLQHEFSLILYDYLFLVVAVF